MGKPERTRAEQLFAATEKRNSEFFNEKAKADKARVAHMEKLRNLRLAKEAADAEAAAQKKAAEAERKATASTKRKGDSKA